METDKKENANFLKNEVSPNFLDDKNNTPNTKLHQHIPVIDVQSFLEIIGKPFNDYYNYLSTPNYYIAKYFNSCIYK